MLTTGLMVVRAVFVILIAAMGLTGSTALAPIVLILALVLLLVDGWPTLVGYVGLAIGLLFLGVLLFGAAFNW